MRFFQLLRAMFRRVAQWGRRILPLAAGADSPIEHRTYQQETVIAMPERDQPDNDPHSDKSQPESERQPDRDTPDRDMPDRDMPDRDMPDRDMPDREDVQPIALPIANQPADPVVVEAVEDVASTQDIAGHDVPGDEAAAESEPVNDVPVDDVPVDDVPVDDVTVDDVLVNDVPVDEASGDETPLDPSLVEDSSDSDLGLDDPALQPLVSLLESLLFVAEDAVTPDKLAQALDRTIGEVEAGLTVLARRCEAENRGIRVQRRSGRVQLVTNPAAAQAVENFLNLDLTTHLSGPALEALAVVAYQQPVTRTQIEAVRGVDCSGVLRKLQQQGLIEEVGRLETIGRPILYGVTDLFMQHFGLTSLTELPQLPEVDADALAAAVELVEEEGNE